MYLVIKYFRDTVEGKLCTIFTDHKPLNFNFLKKKKTSAHHIKFTSDVQRVLGCANVVADALSHVEELPSIIDYAKVAVFHSASEERKMLE